MSVHQAVLKIPDVSPETTEISIKREIIAVGDHPAILIMADYLASMGISVTLIHPFENVSEILDPYKALMASDEDVARYYATIAERVHRRNKIKILSNSHLKDVSGWWGNFTVNVIEGDKDSVLHTSGLAIAYRGNTEVYETPVHEGIFDFTNFLSIIDTDQGSLRKANSPINKIVFLLDTDRRDEKWASVAAIKIGLYLKRNFGTQVFVLCRDLKVSVDGMEREYREARESGILFFKYKDIPVVEGDRQSLSLSFEDASAVSTQDPLKVTLDGLDAVVVQDRFTASEHQTNLLNRLRIAQEDGFVGPNNPQFIGRTSKKGVVVGGDTWFPEYPTDGVSTALSAAEELYKWVGKGKYQIDVQRVAEVDPSKCATCLTCYRICPHDSIRIERYGERNVYITKGEKEGATWEAARVMVETCNGCGLCASECPAKAIQLVYYPDTEVLEFLEKNL